MCGIAGICHIAEPGPVSPDLLKRMVGAISHRGPDGSGLYMDDWAGLGHARLSIIDLSGGAQPIHNESGTVWIVFNGEIFNYPELREDLVRRGHRFYTSTDTEVIVHLYEERREGCLDLLNGQFSLAIWDSKERELFLARDRLGILPLHYTVRGTTLAFSSEIKALFLWEGVERHIDPVAMDQIFTFWTTLPGRTVFRGIQEVPPGHFLRVSGGSVSQKRYWSVPFCPPGEHLRWPMEMVRDEAASLIHDAVRIRLRADVPVGCYLSGGLDSSGITAIVRRDFNNDLRTFGIEFEEGAFDERVHQRRMVSHLGTDHTALLARNDEVGACLPEVLRHCEKPLLRTAPVPLYLLSKTVRDSSFKVVLTGEGADEVFGGYNIFREAKVRRFWARQPESARRPLLLGRLYPYIFDNSPRARGYLRSFFGAGLDRAGDPLFSHLIRWENTRRIRAFFSADLLGLIGTYDVYEDLRGSLPADFDAWDYLSKAQYLETAIFLSSYLLSSQGDRVAMAHSVEVRPPYLDHRLVELLARVPSEMKISVLKEKHLLKEVFRDIVPEEIRVRPKHPYRAPIREALLENEPAYVREVLSGRELRGANLFDAARVGKLAEKLRRAGRAGEVDSMALAGIVSSQLIHRQFVSGFPDVPVRPVEPQVMVDRRRGAAA